MDLKKEIKKLSRPESVVNASSEFYEHGGVWSLKKLILLQRYIDPFLTILTSKDENGDYKYSDACVYMDLCAGAGATKLEDRYKILGSSIISLLNGVFYVRSREEYIRFSKWFFAEICDERSQALEERKCKTLDIIEEKKTEIPEEDVKICGDCNEEVPNFIDEIKDKYENPSILLFVDPEGITEIKWSTLDKIFEIDMVDIEYIFNTQGVKRAISEDILEECFPPSISDEMKKKILSGNFDNKWLTDKFIKWIVEARNRGVYHENVPIKNEKNSEMYRVLWASSSEGGAKSIVPSTLKELKKISNEELRSLLEQVQGTQEGMNGY